MTTLKEIFYDLGNAVSGICDKTYPRSRPKATLPSSRPDSYLVVDVPYFIRNNEIDGCGSYNDFTTTVQIEVYVRDKVSPRSPNGFNLDVMSAKVSSVLKRFPIVTDNIVVTRPVVTLQTDDGDGFGVTIIQGRLRTK